MDQAEILEQVKSITAEYLGADKENIIKESSFIDDLGADSLEAIELTLAIEDKFGIEISDDDQERLRTVGDVVDFIRNSER